MTATDTSEAKPHSETADNNGESVSKHRPQPAKTDPSKQETSAGISTLAIWLALGLACLGIVAGLGLGVLLVSGGQEEDAGGGGGAGGMPPALVVLDTARQEVLQDRTAVIGRLEPVRRSTVSAEVEGRVLVLDLEVGDHIEEDQPLAQIDPVRANLQKQEASASLNSANAVLQRQQTELDYLEQLQAGGSARRKELDDARAAVASAAAATQAAQATLDRAALAVKKVTVLAPFDGYVVSKMVEKGEWVEQGAAVVELVSSGEIDAVIDLPESLVGQVSPGDQVEVTVDASGDRIMGAVAAVTPDAGNAARTFAVKVRLPETNGIKAGMSVTALVPVGGDEPRLTVPRDAVQFDNQGAVIWVSMPPDPASGGGGEGGGGGMPPMPTTLPAPVRVMYGVGDRFAVQPLGDAAGLLRDGTEVVVQGGERLAPGQPLKTNAMGAGSPTTQPGGNQ